jgi:transcriptional regulator with XRE-family HTH domain
MERSTRFNGALLHQLRKERAWSLDDLSQRTGVSISHISQLEKGTRKSPSIDLVFQLSEVLEVSMYALLQTEPEAFSEIDALAYPNEAYAANSPQYPQSIAERWEEWGKTLRPEIVQFIQSDRSEDYLLLAKKLHDHRKSPAMILQIVQEFLQKETAEE